MRARTALVAAAAFLAVQAPALAQQPGGRPDAAQAAKDAATNRAILERLTQRRAEIVRGPGAAADKKEALAFLDKQIAQVKGALGE